MKRMSYEQWTIFVDSGMVTKSLKISKTHLQIDIFLLFLKNSDHLVKLYYSCLTMSMRKIAKIENVDGSHREQGPVWTNRLERATLKEKKKNNAQPNFSKISFIIISIIIIKIGQIVEVEKR